MNDGDEEATTPHFESVSMATVRQGFISHCLSALSYCICGGREKDITEDSQQKDESRLRLVCLSLNESCQERVISSVFCELDGWTSFAFQIHCLDNNVGDRIFLALVRLNKHVQSVYKKNKIFTG